MSDSQRACGMNVGAGKDWGGGDSEYFYCCCWFELIAFLQRKSEEQYQNSYNFTTISNWRWNCGGESQVESLSCFVGFIYAKGKHETTWWAQLCLLLWGLLFTRLSDYDHTIQFVVKELWASEGLSHRFKIPKSIQLNWNFIATIIIFMGENTNNWSLSLGYGKRVIRIMVI